MEKIKPLALIVGGFCILGLASSHKLLAAEAAQLSQVEQVDSQHQQTSSEHRLLITARPGELLATHLQANGQRLFLSLAQSADLAQWRKKAEQLTAQPSIFHDAYVQTLNERSYLVVEFKRPVNLLDETVALNGDNNVSWELLLHERPLSPSIQLLSEIKVVQKHNYYDLSFSGHSEMVVEVSVTPSGEQLVIGLPGVAANEIDLPEMPLFLGMPEVSEHSQGGSVLKFTLLKPIGLLDAQIGSDESKEASFIHLLLAEDAAVTDSQPSVESLKMAQLDAGFGIAVEGAGEILAQSYYLNTPDRLIIDFPGLSADTMESLAKSFTADPRFIKGVRYGSTGLGSGRLELALAPEYTQGLSENTVPFLDRYQGDLVVAMPQAVVRPVEGFPDDLRDIPGFEMDTLRHVASFDFTRQPVLSIGSVTLDDKHYEQSIDMPEGERFGLLEMVDQALLADPQYLAAKAEFRARGEVLPQAKADYLPQISFSYQHSAKYQTVHESGSIPEGHYDVPGYNLTLNLTQPVYRRANLIAIDQAEVAVEQAKVSLLAAEQDLIMRLTSAYLDVLLARDESELAQAEHNAVIAQLEQAQVRFDSGLLSRADYNESRSLEALTRARVMKTEFEYEDARLAVKEITGSEVISLHAFTSDFRAEPPFPQRVDRWVSAALDQNLALQAQRLSTDIASKEVSRRQAEHLPTVDLFATAGQQVSESTLFSQSKQDVSDYEVGLRMSLPLYTGGRTSSMVREADARLDMTHQELNREYRKTERIVRSSYASLVSSATMLSALREGVLAQEIRLATRLKEFEAGRETSVSVLDAYQSYYTARRDFMQSRYEYLKNRLLLKQAVGTLSRNDVAELNMMLESN